MYRHDPELDPECFSPQPYLRRSMVLVVFTVVLILGVQPRSSGLDIARVVDVPLHARPPAKNSSANGGGVRSEELSCVSLFRLAFDRTPLRLTSSFKVEQ